jgi:hypothetical protein
LANVQLDLSTSKTLVLDDLFKDSQKAQIHIAISYHKLRIPSLPEIGNHSKIMCECTRFGFIWCQGGVIPKGYDFNSA